MTRASEALATLAAFLDPARAFSPAADLAPMRAALKALAADLAPPSPKARKAAADLVRRLRNPPWPESIPLSASEAMEEAARMIDAGFRPVPAAPRPLWYVVTYGEKGVGGGYCDCLCDVTFYDSPLAYGRACREAEALHKAGEVDSFSMGRAESSSEALARIQAAAAKRQAKEERAKARAAYQKGAGA